MDDEENEEDYQKARIAAIAKKKKVQNVVSPALRKPVQPIRAPIMRVPVRKPAPRQEEPEEEPEEEEQNEEEQSDAEEEEETPPMAAKAPRNQPRPFRNPQPKRPFNIFNVFGGSKKQVTRPYSRDEALEVALGRVKQLEDASKDKRTGNALVNTGILVFPEQGNLVHSFVPFYLDRDRKTRVAVAVFNHTNMVRKMLFHLQEVRTPFSEKLAIPTKNGWVAYFKATTYDQIPITADEKLRSIAEEMGQGANESMQAVMLTDKTIEEMEEKPEDWLMKITPLVSAVAVIMAAVAIIYLAVQIPNISVAAGKAAGQSVATGILQNLGGILNSSHAGALVSQAASAGAPP